jgi:hypothetical protein
VVIILFSAMPEVCNDLFNKPFEVDKWTNPVSSVKEEDLKVSSAPPAYLHPVTACKIRCNEIAKAKHEECKVKVKQFTEFMKTQGCPGTWCSTKKKSVCPKRKGAATKATCKKKKKK